MSSYHGISQYESGFGRVSLFQMTSETETVHVSSLAVTTRLSNFI